MKISRALAILGIVAAAFACKKTAPVAEDPVPGLIAQLQLPDEEKSGQARLELLRLGEPAVPALRELARSPDPRVRRLGLTTLWGLGARSRPALPEAVAQLEDPDPDLRQTALMLIEANGAAAADARRQVAKHLKDPSVEVRGRAAVALGAMGPAAADMIPALTDAARIEVIRTQCEQAIRRIQGR